MFTIGTIMLLEPKIGISILTIEVLGVDFTKDLTFDFPHILGKIEVDTTLARIKVQNMKIAHWNLPEDM